MKTEHTSDITGSTYLFDISGGDLALDFANTVDNRRSTQLEHLISYGRLLSWCRQAGELTEAEEQRLLVEAARRPQQAQAVLEKALVLREALYRIFSATASERQTEAGDVEVFNRELSGAMAHARLVRADEGFVWGWGDVEGALDYVLWPVLRSAADLLTGGQLGRVRECASETCGWLFIDMSRNGSRRWCDMNDCGNRAKAKRFYERKKREA